MRWMLALLGVSSLFAAGEMPYPDITPQEGPIVKDWAEPFVTGEFLWWRARQEGLAFAASGKAVGEAVPTRAGHFEEMDFDFEPGFRVGAGVKFRYDGWDLYGNYTWLFGPQKRARIHGAEGTAGVFSKWFVFVPASPNASLMNLTKASAKWQMNFSTFDAELGRNFDISHRLALRPHIGFKGAWVDQDYRVNYFSDDTAFPTLSHAKLKFDQDFVGFGIRAGMDSAWICSNHWSIFGDLAFTELWGEYISKRKDKVTPIGSTSDFTSFHSKDKFHTIKPVLELAVGLMYTHEFKNGAWRLNLLGGWEEQYWFDQNQFIDPSQSDEGALNIHGATAKIAFFF